MDENTPESHHEGKSRKQNLNIWTIVSIILALVIIGLILIPNPITGSAISSSEAGEIMVEFLNSKVGGGVELVNVEAEGALYKITVLYQGMEVPVYMTKDGEYFIQGAEKIAGNATAPADDSDNTQPQPQPTEVPKTDKPVVELFVMSHCPYGTQAEKGIIPVAKLLGDKIDFKIKFVYYAMHGEEEVMEQLNQYCIQEEQEDKFIEYLECFLEGGEGASCLASVGIDMGKLEDCTAAADEEFSITANLEDQSSWLSGRFPKFDINKEDNEKYGIAGSPSLIINGVNSNAGRNPASYLAGICAAFSDAPSECSESLTSDNPNPGFGYSASSGGNTAATCG